VAPASSTGEGRLADAVSVLLNAFREERHGLLVVFGRRPRGWHLGTKQRGESRAVPQLRPAECRRPGHDREAHFQQVTGLDAVLLD